MNHFIVKDDEAFRFYRENRFHEAYKHYTQQSNNHTLSDEQIIKYTTYLCFFGIYLGKFDFVNRTLVDWRRNAKAAVKNQYVWSTYLLDGNKDFAQGDYLRAQKNAEEATRTLDLTAEKDCIHYAYIHLLEGKISWRNYNYSDAQYHLCEAHRIFEQHYSTDKHFALAKVRNLLAIIHLEMALDGRGLDESRKSKYWESAKKFYGLVGDFYDDPINLSWKKHLIYAQYHNDHANFLIRYHKKYDSIISTELNTRLEKKFKACETIINQCFPKSHRMKGGILRNRAILNHEQGKLSTTLKQLANEISYREAFYERKHHPSICRAIIRKCEAYIQEKNYQTAINTCYRGIFHIVKKFDNEKHSLLNLDVSISKSESCLEEYAEEEYRNRSHQIDSPYNLLDCLYYLALCHYELAIKKHAKKKKHLESAFLALQKADQLSANMIASTDRDSVGINSKMQRIRELSCKVYLYNQQRGRSNRYVDYFSDKLSQSKQSVDDFLFLTIERSKINFLNRTLQLVDRGETKAKESDLQKVTDQILSSDPIDKIIKENRIETAKFAYNDKVTLAKLRTDIHAGCALVSYYVGKEDAYALVAYKNKKGKFIFYLRKLTSTSGDNISLVDLKKEVKQFKEYVNEGKDTAADTSHLNNFLISAHKLNNYLLKDLKIPKDTRIYIIPHQFIYGIPFELFVHTLRKEDVNYIDPRKLSRVEKLLDTKEIDFLLTRHEFAYHFTFSSLYKMLQAKQPTDDPLNERLISIIGEFQDDLEIEENIAQVEKIWQSARSEEEEKEEKPPVDRLNYQKTPFTTQEVVQLLNCKEQAIHLIVAHNENNTTDNGIASKIQLSYSDKQYLLIEDINQLKLNASLVILGICYGGGDTTNGIMGLNWAFFKSNANNIIYSVAEINAEDALEVLSCYFTILFGDKNKPMTFSKALHDTKLDLHRKGMPFYVWSNFLFMGIQTIKLKAIK